MNPLVALPFSGLLIVLVVLVWTGFRDKRPSESTAEVQLKSARQLLEVMKLEDKREAEASVKK
jgi:type II secretory pathway pseudopilin PulG